MRGRYEARVKGKDATGELVFRKPGRNIVDAVHTAVPVALRGNGIGTQLVERMVADARSEGFKIVPSCPFVKSKFEQHPEWSDLLQAQTSR